MSVLEMGRRLFGLFLSLCLASPAYATVIDVDPGPVGSMPPEIVLPFTELNGMTFDGSQHSLDFVFSAMKRLELGLEGQVQYRA